MLKKLCTTALVLFSFHIFSQDVLNNSYLGLDLPYYKSDFITNSNDGNYWASGKIYKYDYVDLWGFSDSTYNALLKFDPQGNTINSIELEGYQNFELSPEVANEVEIHFIKENNDQSVTYFSGLNVYNIDKDFKAFNLLETFKESGKSYSDIKSKVFGNTIIIHCNQRDQNNNYSGLEIQYDLDQMSIISRNSNELLYGALDVEKDLSGNSFLLFNNRIIKNDITNNELWSYTLTSNVKINDIIIDSKNEILAAGFKIQGDKKLGVLIKLNNDGQYVDEMLIDRHPVYETIGASVLPVVELTKIQLVENGNVVVFGKENTEWSFAYKVAIKVDSNFSPLWEYRPGDSNTLNNTYDHLLVDDNGNYIVFGTQLIFESPPISSISVISKENSVNNKNIIEDKISIFPNPSSDFLVLENEISETNLMYTIFNYEGRVVKKGTYISKIDISNLVQGQYYLQLENEITNSIQRFIKI